MATNDIEIDRCRDSAIRLFNLLIDQEGKKDRLKERRKKGNRAGKKKGRKEEDHEAFSGVSELRGLSICYRVETFTLLQIDSSML